MNEFDPPQHLMSVQPVVLAAGKGSRMKSGEAKVLAPLGGTTLIEHVLSCCEQTAKKATTVSIEKPVVVVGHGAEKVRRVVGERVDYCTQHQQLGTGHAVDAAMKQVKGESLVVVLYGDVPLLSPETLANVIAAASPFALITVELDNPGGYGRIIRDESGALTAIVEERDATSVQREIKEINTGIMAIQASLLREYLSRIDNNNAQGEYYLTDIIELAARDQVEIRSVQPASAFEVLGVNTRRDLAAVEHHLQQNSRNRLMDGGVTLFDPNQVYIRGQVEAGQDVQIDANVILAGKVVLGDRVKIGANTIIENSHIGNDSVIHSFSHLSQATVGKAACIGPYARLRPHSTVGDHAKIGNFVEMKKATAQKGAKINHLSYVGDASIGEGANLGAGTITCNYDGLNKHQTDIGRDAFIGSNASLVAPVSVGEGATVAAGSVVTENVEPDSLYITRAKAYQSERWVRPDHRKK